MENTNILPEDIIIDDGEVVIDENAEPEEGEEAIPAEPEEPTEEPAKPEAKPAEGGGKTVPHEALVEAREKNRKIREENERLRNALSRVTGSANGSPDDLERHLDEVEISRYMRTKGVDADTARIFLEQQKELAGLREAENRRKFDTEAAELAGDELYSDISDVRSDVEELAAKAGITLKQAYNALYGDNMQKKKEEAVRRSVLEEMQKKQNADIKGLSSAGSAGKSSEGSYGLTAQQLEVAKAAGMSPKDYAKYNKKD